MNSWEDVGLLFSLYFKRLHMEHYRLKLIKLLLVLGFKKEMERQKSRLDISGHWIYAILSTNKQAL